MTDGTPSDGGPELVRQRLRLTAPGDWYVFETFAADGTRAIGVARGIPDPSICLVVYEGSSQPVAAAAAAGLARWHRDQGRDVGAD